MKCLLEQSRAPNSSAAAGLGSEGRRAESSKLVVLAILSELLVQEFKSDITAQAGVLGPVNHTHPPAAQFLQDFVVRNSLADHGVGTRRLSSSNELRTTIDSVGADVTSLYSPLPHNRY